jgi:hypothetical protein
MQLRGLLQRAGYVVPPASITHLTVSLRIRNFGLSAGKTPSWVAVLVLLMASFAIPSITAAQVPVGCNVGWGTVPRFTGTFELTGTGSSSTTDSSGDTRSFTTKQHITGSISMSALGLPIPGGGTCYPGAWNGTAIESINIVDVFVYTPANGDPERNEVVVQGGQNIPSGNPPSLTANPLAGIFELDLASFTGVDTGLVNATLTNGTFTRQGQVVWGPATATAVPPIGRFLTGPLPTTVGPITGSVSFQALAAENTAGGDTCNWTLTWNLVPVLPKFDLIVKMPAYPTWRPTAGRTEKDTGLDPSTGQPNILEIDTQLVDTTTGQNSFAEKLTFSLTDFSSETCVSMNWPPPSLATDDPDLTFEPKFNPLASISPDGTTLTSSSPGVGLPANPTVFLSPHDWGAWATLHVTAEVNGQTIKGHLADSSNDILLPKRQAGSHIADVWKSQHAVALTTPDDDDSEPDPAGYPGCLGDGFTLYEEYRGFSENGKHIEGDPHKKDFFIENLIGADAEPGIFLFTELTSLNVHKDIQKSETKIDHPNGSLGSILINFNRSQGAHSTDQHGVTIVGQNFFPGTFRSMDGGLTILSVAGVHARPGITDGIGPGGGPTVFIPGSVDNTAGLVTATADTLQGAIPGASGSGTLVVFDFTSLAAGTSNLGILNVTLLDSSLSPIPETTVGGSVTVGSTLSVPEPSSLFQLLIGACALTICFCSRPALSLRARGAGRVGTAHLV